MSKQCSRLIYEFSRTRNELRAEGKILKRCGNYMNKIYLEDLDYNNNIIIIIIIYGVRSQSYCQKYQMLYFIEKIINFYSQIFLVFFHWNYILEVQKNFSMLNSQKFIILIDL